VADYIVIQKPKPNCRGGLTTSVMVVGADSAEAAIRAFKDKAGDPGKDYTRPTASLLDRGREYWV
jgi:hypothetical protein